MQLLSKVKRKHPKKDSEAKTPEMYEIIVGGFPVKCAISSENVISHRLYPKVRKVYGFERLPIEIDKVKYSGHFSAAVEAKRSGKKACVVFLVEEGKDEDKLLISTQIAQRLGLQQN